MVKTIIKTKKSKLAETINGIIEENWRYVRKKITPYTNDKLFLLNLPNGNNSSNYRKAIKELENELGIVGLKGISIQTRPRFDINQTRNTGFSHSGCWNTLIAVFEIEDNMYEIASVNYCEWLR